MTKKKDGAMDRESYGKGQRDKQTNSERPDGEGWGMC